jgi:predicted phage terminase large subunit-like protein
MTEPRGLSQLTDNELLSLERCLRSDSDAPLSADEIERIATSLGLPSTRDRSGRLTDREYADKLACETSLHAFVERAWPIVEPGTPFVDGPHLWALCAHAEALRFGLIRNLLVAIPPGCMKSLLWSVFYPPWIWSTEPSSRFMFASYDQSLSTRDSVRCRSIVESDWYRSLWGDVVALVGDQNEKTRFDTVARGWRIATSVGGRGTGEHPDYLIVDDPLNAKRATSETERKACAAWWDGTMTTRGEIRDVRRAVIAQRLAPADLHGHILEVDAGLGAWEYLMLPMEYEPERHCSTSIGWSDWRSEPGELLWPAAYSREKVDRLKRSLGSKRAAGQLQQRPVSLDGEVFQRAWFQIVDAAPADATRVRFWDKAGTEGAGKFTAGVRMSCKAGAFYIEDVQRAQLSFGKREQFIRQIATLDADTVGYVRTWLEQEPGSGGKDSGKISVISLAGFDVRLDVVSGQGSKVVRAQGLSSQAEAGNVFLVRGPWNATFLDEIEAFPGGEYSDQVDASSGAFNKLALGAGDGADYVGDVVASGEDDDERRPFGDDELAELPDELRELIGEMRGLRGNRRGRGRSDD